MHIAYRATVTATLHIGPHECKNRQCQFGQDMTYLTTICSLKSFHANFMVSEVSVTHVTSRATVTATLHMGPHECKTGKQCQFGQDMTYLTIICSVEKFSIIFCGIRGIGRTRYHIEMFFQGFICHLLSIQVLLAVNECPVKFSP